MTACGDRYEYQRIEFDALTCLAMVMSQPCEVSFSMNRATKTQDLLCGLQVWRYGDTLLPGL